MRKMLSLPMFALDDSHLETILAHIVEVQAALVEHGDDHAPNPEINAAIIAISTEMRDREGTIYSIVDGKLVKGETPSLN